MPDAGDEVGAEFLRAAWDVLREELGWDQAKAREEEPRRRSDGRLDKGVRLLSSVNAGDVASRTSLSSTGAFYKRWPERRQFVEDLADYVLSGRRAAQEDDPDLEAFDAAVREGRPIPDALDAAARAGLTALVESPAFAVKVNIWSVSRRYPSMRARLRSLYRDATARWTARLETVAGLLGWRLRPGLDTATFGVLVTALAEGLAMRRSVDPEAVSDEMYTAGLHALLYAFVDWDDHGEGLATALGDVSGGRNGGRRRS
jgi:AcrR family transcriptional regulator